MFGTICAIITLSLMTQVELKGNLSGLLDYSGKMVIVREGDSVKVVPYGTNGDYDNTGWLIIKTRSIYVEGVIDGMGRGYGGGGGGGGAAYNDYGDANPGAGGGDKARFEGSPGGNAHYEEITPGQQWAVYGGDGGSGGGIGGDGGMDGAIGTGGTGGRGAGPYGGAGGGSDGGPGGYMGGETNGDSTIAFGVVMGSGGGGGGGGDATYDDGYPGGSGGVGGGSGCRATDPLLSGGGGGGGGGAGGAAITLDIEDTLSISGAVIADGAGYAELGAGYGAGGGIALRGEIVDVSEGLIRTLGGFSDRKGTRINGGTIKVFYKNLKGDIPEENAGRVYKKEMPSGVAEERRSLPLLIVSPNPGKAVSSVKCQVFSGEEANLRVYNALGKLIKTLAKTQSQGSKAYTVVWDGRDEKGDLIPSGVYFLKLEGKGYTLVRKFTLMR